MPAIQNIAKLPRTPRFGQQYFRSPVRTPQVLPSLSSLQVQVVTEAFLDRKKVIDALSRRERRAFMRIGGYMRRTMKNSMAKSAATEPHSPPGKPPRYSNGLLRDRIFFWYDRRRHSVIVGPEYKQTNPTVKPVGKTVPQLLDEGGKAFAARPQLVIRDRTKNRIISLASLGGQRIYNRASFKKGMKKKNKKARYHLMRVKPGQFTFKGNPFKMNALNKAIQAPRLQSAWASVR